jgi:hypothetical protein
MAVATFDVIVETKNFEEKLSRLERLQLPFARSLAANTAAFETMGTLRAALPLIFDRPTPFTVRGVGYRKGNKLSPAAEVFLSGDASKGTPPTDYLAHQIAGGRRKAKRGERVLQRARILTANEGYVPAAVKLDRYGNVPARIIVQILSQIRAFGEEGFSANQTDASKRRSAKKNRRKYFLVSRAGEGLPRGVYERYGPGLRNIKPVLLFVPLPTYQKRFDFPQLARDELRRRFVLAWPNALRRALASAR